MSFNFGITGVSESGSDADTDDNVDIVETAMAASYAESQYTEDIEEDDEYVETIAHTQRTDCIGMSEQIFLDSDDELYNVPNYKGLGEADDTMWEYRCVLCKTLPYTRIYQCGKKHILCGGCYHVRILDKMLGARLGTCPECKELINRRVRNRNPVIEQILATMNVACSKCGMAIQRAYLRAHMQALCPQRRVACKYKRLGCKWTGIVGAAVQEHEKICSRNGKTGAELLDGLKMIQAARDVKFQLVEKIMKLMQLPNIASRLVHLLPQRGGFSPNDLYICTDFQAFKRSWYVQIVWRTPDVEFRVPSEYEYLSCNISFRLKVFSDDAQRQPLKVSYSMISSAYSDVHFRANICEKFSFDRERVNGPLTVIYKNNWLNCYTLLTERGFYARLFLVCV